MFDIYRLYEPVLYENVTDCHKLDNRVKETRVVSVQVTKEKIVFLGHIW